MIRLLPEQLLGYEVHTYDCRLITIAVLLESSKTSV